MRILASCLALSVLACASVTEPSEPVRRLTLPDGISLASGQYGFDPTTRDYVVFLGLHNDRSVPVDVTYGLCTFLVIGYAGAEVSGERLWTRLLPQNGGCSREIGLVLRVAALSTGYVTVGTVPATVLDGSGSVGLVVQIEGESNLRVVHLAEVIVD